MAARIILADRVGQFQRIIIAIVLAPYIAEITL